MIAQELEVSLHMAFVEARQQRHEFITVEHLLLALLDNPSAAEVLRMTTSGNAELLALFFRTGMQGLSAIDIGRMLLKKYGNLTALSRQQITEIQKQKGLGPAKALDLAAALLAADVGRAAHAADLACLDAANGPKGASVSFALPTRIAKPWRG